MDEVLLKLVLSESLDHLRSLAAPVLTLDPSLHFVPSSFLSS